MWITRGVDTNNDGTNDLFVSLEVKRPAPPAARPAGPSLADADLGAFGIIAYIAFLTTPILIFILSDDWAYYNAMFFGTLIGIGMWLHAFYATLMVRESLRNLGLVLLIPIAVCGAVYCFGDHIRPIFTINWPAAMVEAAIISAAVTAIAALNYPATKSLTAAVIVSLATIAVPCAIVGWLAHLFLLYTSTIEIIVTVFTILIWLFALAAKAEQRN